jgi:hypothetical protein
MLQFVQYMLERKEFRSLILANYKAHRHGDYLDWKDRFLDAYGKFVTEHIPKNIGQSPVRIAILDTGLDVTHRDMEARKAQIRGTYNWISDRNHRQNISDSNGHGTHTAGLILDYAADAELYVAKIADNEPCDPVTIANVSNSFTTNSLQISEY